MLTESVLGSDEKLTETIVSLYSKLDIATARHQYRVSKIALLIAEIMALGKQRAALIETAAIIHDIGKIKVPAEALLKQRGFNDLEPKIIRRHPITGYYILVDLGCPTRIADIILHHHERLDGSGYPLGIEGDRICFEAQLIAVADVIDTLKYGKSNNPNHNILEIAAELKSNSGKLYNEDIVEAVTHNISTIDSTYRTYILNKYAKAMMRDQEAGNLSSKVQ
jgi:putative nucleotidyltransferase with HDIG domain